MNTILLDLEYQTGEVYEGMGSARGFSPDGDQLELQLYYTDYLYFPGMTLEIYDTMTESDQPDRGK